MPIVCKTCGYDISNYSCKLVFDVGHFQNLINCMNERDTTEFFEKPNVKVFCPICGAENKIFLTDMNVTVRKENVGNLDRVEIIQWQPSNTKASTAISVGALTFEFTGSRTLSPQELCFKKVPIFFSTESKKLQIPAFPLKPEFFDLIDFDRLQNSERKWERGRLDERNQYSAKIPLKGMRELQPISLEILYANNNAQLPTTSRAFSGMDSSIWPDVPYKDWKFFYLEVNKSENSNFLLKEYNKFQVKYASSNNGQFEDFTKSVNNTSTDARLWFHVQTNARPRWLAVSFDDQSGGIFDIWEGTNVEQPYPDGVGELAVDMGTSNTCVAVLKGDKPEISKISSLRRIILGNEPTTHPPTVLTSPVPAPPLAGFGRSGDLLPSELLGYPMRDVFQEPINQQKDNLVPFSDYTIPSAGVQLQYPEGDSLISDFKFPDSFKKYGNYNQEHAQARYVKCLLLIHLAQIASKDSAFARKNYRVCYSYPTVFDGDQRGSLKENVFKPALLLLGQWTGISLNLNIGRVTDEAQAAGSNISSELLDGYILFADLGGGTLDVSLIHQEGKGKETVYSTSLRYAGSVMLNAYTPSMQDFLQVEENDRRYTPCSVLDEKATQSMLKRKIRECQRLRDVFADSSIFSTPRATLRKNRSNIFFNYLIEYLARMLAAAILNKSGSQKFMLERPVVINFIPLGNAWGFLDDIPNYDAVSFSKSLKQRTIDILNIPQLKLAVNYKDIKDYDIAHEKAAVVYGLLKTNESLETGDDGNTTLLGINTSVLYPEQQEPIKLTWSTTVRPDTSNDLPQVQKQAFFSWDFTEEPVIPQVINSPETHKKATDLRHTSIVGKIRREMDTHTGFNRSPFEVMMEEIFAKLVAQRN